jgi:hypothetical protein
VQAEEINATLMTPLNALLVRLRQLYAMADERQVIRAETSHYREKVTRLANDGLSNVKAQAKAESNQEKLFRNQQRFKELDTELAAAFAGLDHEISVTMNTAIAKFVQIQANYATGLLHCYGNALAAIPGTVRTGGGPAAAVDAGRPGAGEVSVPGTSLVAVEAVPDPIMEAAMHAATTRPTAYATEATPAGGEGAFAMSSFLGGSEQPKKDTWASPSSTSAPTASAPAANPFDDHHPTTSWGTSEDDSGSLPPPAPAHD